MRHSDPFLYESQLQYENKNLRRQLKEFRSGEAFCRMREGFEKVLREKDRRIRELEQDNAGLRTQIVKNREMWMQVNEDVLREKEQLLKRFEALQAVNGQRLLFRCEIV